MTIFSSIQPNFPPKLTTTIVCYYASYLISIILFVRFSFNCPPKSTSRRVHLSTFRYHIPYSLIRRHILIFPFVYKCINFSIFVMLVKTNIYIYIYKERERERERERDRHILSDITFHTLSYIDTYFFFLLYMHVLIFLYLLCL